MKSGKDTARAVAQGSYLPASFSGERVSIPGQFV